MRVLRRKYAEPTPIEDCPADMWGPTEHLLADICDKLEILYRIQLTDKDRTPVMTPRPGYPSTQPKRGAAAWFAGMGYSP